MHERIPFADDDAAHDEAHAAPYESEQILTEADVRVPKEGVFVILAKKQGDETVAISGTVGLPLEIGQPIVLNSAGGLAQGGKTSPLEEIVLRDTTVVFKTAHSEYELRRG